MILADDEVIGQDDDVGLDVFGDALGSGSRDVEQYGLAGWEGGGDGGAYQGEEEQIRFEFGIHGNHPKFPNFLYRKKEQRL